MRYAVPENIRTVTDRLEDCGYEAFIAGGCVRDMLMGVPPHDYDIATNARPDEVRKCFDSFRVIDTGIKHGTVTVVSGGENVEITTYRSDGVYKDHRRPEKVTFSESLTEDLSRRDLTINAMAYSEKTGIVDIFGGREDLERHIIRCVGDPRVRFEEDALRILRTLRFSSVLGFEPDEASAAAVHEMKHLIDAVSRERIRSELEKTICGVNIKNVMIGFPDVFAQAVPGISGVISRGKWEITAERIALSERDSLLRFMLLFCEADETAEEIMKELRSDRDSFRTAGRISAHIAKAPCTELSDARKLVRDIGANDSLMIAKMLKSIAAADGDDAGVSDSVKMCDLIGKIVSEDICCSLDKLAFGGDDARKMGFSGKNVGKLLDHLLTGVIEERFPNTAEALGKAASEFGNK